MNEFILVLLTIILVIGIIGIGYLSLFNNLLAYKIKIIEADNVIDELIAQKKNYINDIKTIINSKTNINKKILDPLNKIDDANLSSVELERKLTDCFELIDKIKDDYSSVSEDEKFNNIYQELYILDEKLEASKTFFNKYTNYLNTKIKKFPIIFIAKIHHIKPYIYFDCKKHKNK